MKVFCVAYVNGFTRQKWISTFGKVTYGSPDYLSTTPIYKDKSRRHDNGDISRLHVMQSAKAQTSRHHVTSSYHGFYQDSKHHVMGINNQALVFI